MLKILKNGISCSNVDYNSLFLLKNMGPVSVIYSAYEEANNAAAPNISNKVPTYMVRRRSRYASRTIIQP